MQATFSQFARPGPLNGLPRISNYTFDPKLGYEQAMGYSIRSDHVRKKSLLLSSLTCVSLVSLYFVARFQCGGGEGKLDVLVCRRALRSHEANDEF